MNQKLQLFKTSARNRITRWRIHTEYLVRRYWLRTFLLAFGAFLLIRKDVSINLNLNSVAQPVSFLSNGTENPDPDTPDQPMNVSMLSKNASGSKAVAISLTTDSKEPNLANSLSNANKLSDEELAKRAAKRKKQLAYVKRYYRIAQKEMEKYSIPASITLAQGLLESNMGESRLAIKNNNHFGIKCFSRKCKKGHCTNFTDDSHKDFFRKYNNAWESFRAHSELLTAKRYQSLQDLHPEDYRGWAKGLKKAGYATDPTYADKLIEMIEDLELYEYDGQ